MRAHANCVENLPVYGAVVVGLVASGIRSPLLDGLAIVLLLARVCQTIVHVAFWQFAATFGRSPVLKPVTFGLAVNFNGYPA